VLTDLSTRNIAQYSNEKFRPVWRPLFIHFFAFATSTFSSHCAFAHKEGIFTIYNIKTVPKFSHLILICGFHHSVDCVTALQTYANQIGISSSVINSLTTNQLLPMFTLQVMTYRFQLFDKLKIWGYQNSRSWSHSLIGHTETVQPSWCYPDLHTAPDR
jgi:hypothetical protein